MEKKINFQLSTIEGMQLNLHKFVCDACLQYEKQSILLEKWMAKKEEDTDKNLPEVSEKEVDALKEKILKHDL